MPSTHQVLKSGNIAMADRSWLQDGHGKEKVRIIKVDDIFIEYEVISTGKTYNLFVEDYHFDYSQICHMWFIFPNSNLIAKIAKDRGVK